MTLPTPIPNLNNNSDAKAGNISTSPVTFGDVSTGFSNVGGLPQIFIIGVGVLFVCVVLKALKKKSS